MLKWKFDANADVLYVRVAEGKIAGQAETADGLVVDLDSDGRAVGVEIIHPRDSFDAEALTAFGVDEVGIARIRALASLELRATVTQGPGRADGKPVFQRSLVLT